jgi:uridine monophosphate synthetase
VREIIRQKKLKFDAVAGVPDAGEPFAHALSKLTKKPLLRMTKWEHDGKRHIAQLQLPIPVSVKKVLLIDDVTMRAHSKVEAVDIGRDAGLEVTDIMVVIDYEQGGKDVLAARGCNMHSVFTVSEPLQLYSELKKISPRLWDDIQKYLMSQV